jgi:hypothetical protein
MSQSLVATWKTSGTLQANKSMPTQCQHVQRKIATCHCTLEDRRASVFINPIFNNGDNSDPQSSQHQLPKWGIQLLKDVRLDEQNKTGTRSSTKE